jgi:hypothetical protein
LQDQYEVVLSIDSIHERPVTAIAFHHGSSMAGVKETTMCTVSKDRVIVWEVETAIESRTKGCNVIAQDLQNLATSVCFDTTGALIAMSIGYEVEVLQTEDGQVMMRLEGHDGRITVAKFLPTAHHMLATISEGLRLFSSHPCLFFSLG